MPNRTRTRTRREEYTSETAKQFGRYSMNNAMLVAGSLRCGCQPYKDVFTYNRWRALGYQVQRGERSISLPLVKMVEVEGDDGEVVEQRRVMGSSAVFCRCQVKPIEVR